MAFDFNAQTNKNYLQTINPNAPDAGAALKVLSLNLPNYLGGNPIAPDALLRPGLSLNAQVGGTGTGEAPTPAPAAPASSGALPDVPAALSAQLGSPLSSPSDVSPFSSAPITNVAASALGTAPQDTNNFAAQNAASGTPRIEFDAPARIGDVFGGGPAPAPPPTPSSVQGDGGALDPLAQLLAGLLNGSFSGGAPDRSNDTQMI